LVNQFNKIIKQFILCLKSRKQVIMVYSWFSVISLFITCREFPPPILLFKLFCAMTGTSFGVYFYNDICDIEEDLARGKILDFTPASRPLSRGLISKRRLGAFSVLMVTLGLTASSLINSKVLLAQLMFLALGIVYSTKPIRLKRFFLMKQVTIAIGGAIACLSAGLAVGIITVQLLYLTGLIVLFVAGFSPFLDINDMESDRIGMIKTIPIVWGPGFTIRLALATFTASAATTWIGFFGLGFNIVLPILGTVVLVAMAYVIYPLLGNLEDYEHMLKAIYGRVLPLFILLQFTVLLGSLSF